MAYFDYKSVLINLKILGKLDTGIKINTKNPIFSLDENGWKAMVTRTWRVDDRNQTYDKISKLVEDVSQLLDSKQYSNELYKDILNEAVDFKDIIDAAITGLTKLKGTYINDKTFVAKIEVEIGLLTRLSNKIKIDRPKEIDKEKETETETETETEKEKRNIINTISKSLR